MDSQYAVAGPLICPLDRLSPARSSTGWASGVHSRSPVQSRSRVVQSRSAWASRGGTSGPGHAADSASAADRAARSNSGAGITFLVSAWMSGCTWTVRVVLAGLMVTRPARARLCTASRAWAGSPGMAGCPVMYPHAAWLVNTTPGMPAGSSSAASASIGRANPAGAIWSARSMASDQVTSTMPGSVSVAGGPSRRRRSWNQPR